MNSEHQDTRNKKNKNSLIWLILSLIFVFVAGYIYIQSENVVDQEALFSTYYMLPAEVENVRGAGPFKNELNHGYYLYSQKDFDRCLEIMQKVIKDDPRNKGHVSMAHYISGHCYIQKKDFDKAKIELDNTSHFGVRVNLLLIELLQGEITEEQYIDQKTLKF